MTKCVLRLGKYLIVATSPSVNAPHIVINRESGEKQRAEDFKSAFEHLLTLQKEGA